MPSEVLEKGPPFSDDDLIEYMVPYLPSQSPLERLFILDLKVVQLQEVVDFLKRGTDYPAAREVIQRMINLLNWEHYRTLEWMEYVRARGQGSDDGYISSLIAEDSDDSDDASTSSQKTYMESAIGQFQVENSTTGPGVQIWANKLPNT